MEVLAQEARKEQAAPVGRLEAFAGMPHPPPPPSAGPPWAWDDGPRRWPI